MWKSELWALLPVMAFSLAVRGESPKVDAEFLFEKAPFAQCHASTIVDSSGELVAAWFAGQYEKHPSVGIWVARREAGKWSAPVEVANGQSTDGKRYPCWNPVLFKPSSGPLLLYYKVGPDPTLWWGMVRKSDDQGKTWSEATRLPDGFLGPIKNKPIVLADGAWLFPSSTESPDKQNAWRIHFERSSDQGATWTKSAPSYTDKPFGAIQPAILRHDGARLQAVGRSQAGKVFSVWSNDGGRSWGTMGFLDLPNPNSGVDAVTLRDGRHLLIYNHTTKGRTPLNLALSTDGKKWEKIADLETNPGEYSYPAIIQSADGKIHATYTWQRRRVRHVEIDMGAHR